MAFSPRNRTSILQQFFSPVGQDVIGNPNRRTASNFKVGKGSLITFNYAFWKNDAYPLVVVSKSAVGDKLWGVNLHYLTFNYIKQILGMSYNNPGFSYDSIKSDKYVVGAYRSYKWSGIRQVKVLDYKFLLNLMSMVRTFDPAEVQIIRRQVQDQIRQQINPKASQITTLGQGGTAGPNTGE
jgi:hypothetical protein